MKFLSFLLLVFLSFSSLSEGWEVSDDNWMSVRGDTVNSHKFGFVKNTKSCDNHMPFLTWSTYEKGLEEFEGSEVDMEFYFGLKRGIISMELVKVFNTPLMSLAMFSNVYVSDKFLDFMGRYDNLTINFVGPKELVDKLDIKIDDFNISGFKNTFDQVQTQCKSLNTSSS